MNLSRSSVGLAVKAARKVAELTGEQLAERAGMTASAVSRTENGLRSLEFHEAVAISQAVGLNVEALRTLAETFERSGVEARMSNLKRDFNDLQRAAIEAAIRYAQQ